MQIKHLDHTIIPVNWIKLIVQYDINIFKLCEWIDENIYEKNVIGWYSGGGGGWNITNYIAFKHEEDAMAFKLRWE